MISRTLTLIGAVTAFCGFVVAACGMQGYAGLIVGAGVFLFVASLTNK